MQETFAGKEERKMYDPKKLIEEYNQLENGKAKMAGLKEAIRQADENHDVAYQIYFRSRFVAESVIYGDCLDSLIIFPQMLAIIDENPNAPKTSEKNDNFEDATDRVLWFYKMIISHCIEFYQIPLEDCEKFFEDFKRRSIAYGYNLRPYYYYKHFFYKNCGDSRVSEAFSNFMKLPRDGNADCKACEQNAIVQYYMLEEDNLEKATFYAKDLESRKLRCSNDNRSWIRLKCYYLCYYLRHQDLKEAKKYIDLIKYNMGKLKVCDIAWYELYYYSLLDVSKGLKIYKVNWKNWLEERNPDELFNNNAIIALFFKKLEEGRVRKTVKIAFDKKFPLYREDDTYEIEKLYEFYYNNAKDLADKFDKRNGTEQYKKKLERVMRGEWF